MVATVFYKRSSDPWRSQNHYILPEWQHGCGARWMFSRFLQKSLEYCGTGCYLMWFWVSFPVRTLWINSVASTFVPKLQNVNRAADFGPISCCSTICKCISKILANRLRVCLPSLISFNPTAFIQVWKIGGHILIGSRNYKG